MEKVGILTEKEGKLMRKIKRIKMNEMREKI